MPESILYLLKANLAIILFYLGYRLLLRRLTFYTLNRFYLLFALLFSITYPLFDFARWFNPPVQELPGEVAYIIADWEQVSAEVFNGWPFLVGLITLGALWFAARLVIRLLSLRRIHRQSHAATWHWFSYRRVFVPIRPFSFWRNIYVNVENHPDSELVEIFRHEQVHASELHTVDILLAELCSIWCWFNPGMWLLRHAIRENLEFITDRDVLRSGVDKQAYQYSLLGVGRRLEAYPDIANGFNFKNLKRRIMMMNRKKSSQLQLGRYLFAVPVIAVFVLFFTMSRAASDATDVALATDGSENTVVIEFTPDQPGPQDEPEHEAGSLLQNEPEVKVLVQPEKDRLRDKVEHDTVKSKRDTSIVTLVKPQSNDKGDPLFVLDDKVQEEGFDIREIDPNTIERVDVLKDASATALYGKRGAHGVVIITSKGKAQREPTGTDTTSLREIRIIGYGKKEGSKNESSVADGGFNGALIVIDGKESTAAALQQLSPEEITSIDVLKGTKATDKYGDKGEKGVIEVSTATGK